MDFITEAPLEDRLRRMERKITILSILTLSTFLSLKTEQTWAKLLLLIADLLLLLDTGADLVRELCYKTARKKNCK